MDRIHRLGQRRPVQAIKLVVEDSIESRIVQVSSGRSCLTIRAAQNHLQLQEKKSAMIDATLSTDDSVCMSLGINPPCPNDVGGLGDG
jgi:DNA repair protein RAD16